MIKLNFKNGEQISYQDAQHLADLKRKQLEKAKRQYYEDTQVSEEEPFDHESKTKHLSDLRKDRLSIAMAQEELAQLDLSIAEAKLLQLSRSHEAREAKKNGLPTAFESADDAYKGSGVRTERLVLKRLCEKLNLNLKTQFSASDMANLVATIMSCNESQLNALYNNPDLPLVLKTIIKRLQEDASLGNIDTVEKLWDRIFGKGNMVINLPQVGAVQQGILPNTPITRETYVMIRETLLNN